MVKYYLELWFHFVCIVVLLLVPFLFYNLLCFFSVISLLFSKGCWLCVNWTHYALPSLCVCVMYAACACRPWPAPEGALQSQIFACGNGLRRRRATQQALGSAASSLRVSADGSGDEASSPGSVGVCAPKTGADLIIGACQGVCFGYCLMSQCSADVSQCILQDQLKDESLQRPDDSRFCSTLKPISMGENQFLASASMA